MKLANHQVESIDGILCDIWGQVWRHAPSGLSCPVSLLRRSNDARVDLALHVRVQRIVPGVVTRLLRETVLFDARPHGPYHPEAETGSDWSVERSELQRLGDW